MFIDGGGLGVGGNLRRRVGGKDRQFKEWQYLNFSPTSPAALPVRRPEGAQRRLLSP